MRRGGETARALPVSRLRGNGRFGFAVVGESHRQSELEEIVGGRTEEGAEFECTALLVPEPDNAFDQNAIMVFIEAQKIGCASRGQFREARADERPLFIGITSAFVALQHVSGYHAAVVVGVMLLFALSAPTVIPSRNWVAYVLF
jgi:hypothetical protein